MNFCRFYNRTLIKLYNYLKTKDEIFKFTPVKQIPIIDGMITIILLCLFVLATMFFSHGFRLYDRFFDILNQIYNKRLVSKCEEEESK